MQHSLFLRAVCMRENERENKTCNTRYVSELSAWEKLNGKTEHATLAISASCLHRKNEMENKNMQHSLFQRAAASENDVENKNEIVQQPLFQRAVYIGKNKTCDTSLFQRAIIIDKKKCNGKSKSCNTRCFSELSASKEK